MRRWSWSGIQTEEVSEKMDRVTELNLLRDLGVISEERYREAVEEARKLDEQEKAQKTQKLDIYLNKRGELCIIFRYSRRQWNIRIPLLYEPWQWLQEHYPSQGQLAKIKGQKSNRALWRVLLENKRKINELHRERQERFRI